MIVVFCGKKRSGKDTCAQYLVDNYDFRASKKLAAPIKDIGKLLFGWTDDMVEGINYDREQQIPELGMSVREFLQECGSLFKYNLSDLLPDYKEALGTRIWVKLLVKWLKEQDSETNFVLSDMRFPEEADEILKAFPDTHIVRLIAKDNASDMHISEISVDYIPADIYLHNVGTLDELYTSIDTIMESIGVSKKA